MRIAIIGATGMLGQHAARAALAAGHELIVVHRGRTPLSRLDGIPFREALADLDDRAALTRALQGAEAVLNCAGYYPTLPRPWREEVATATAQMENFYSACAAHGRLHRVVYLGGAIALQRRRDGAPATESDEYPGAPPDRNAYVQVKWAMDAQARRKAAEGLPVVIGIPSMSFGEYDFGPTTGRFIVEIAKGSLPGYVRGRRNVVYAGDAGRGLIRCLEDGRAGERYLITGSNTDMDAVTALIARLAGQPQPKAIPLPLAKLVNRLQTLAYRLGAAPPKVDATAIAVMSAGQHLSGDKAAAELGYSPTVGLEDAVARALAWFREVGYVC